MKKVVLNMLADTCCY